jgi:transcriptional regulator with XRE-family HTH domain
MDIGAELRAAREAKGLSLATLAHRTRVQPRILEAIELNNLTAIPPKPFGRGFIRSYAREVDLDPDETVDHYFGQFPASEPPPSSVRTSSSATPMFDWSSHWTGFATATVIVVLLLTVALVRDPQGDAAREAGAIGTSGSAAPASTPTHDVRAASTDSPLGARGMARPSAPVRLAFSVSRPCWVTAHVDGRRAIYQMVLPGDARALEAQGDIAIRFGDAGAVKWSINGREGKSLGADGTIRDLRLTPESSGALAR